VRRSRREEGGEGSELEDDENGTRERTATNLRKSLEREGEDFVLRRIVSERTGGIGAGRE